MDASLTTDLIQSFVVATILIFPLWKIYDKAGFHPALSLIIFIPWYGLLVSSLVLAFISWPILKKANGSKED